MWKALDMDKRAYYIIIKKYDEKIRPGEWLCDIKNCGDDGTSEGYANPSEILLHYRRWK